MKASCRIGDIARYCPAIEASHCPSDWVVELPTVWMGCGPSYLEYREIGRKVWMLHLRRGLLSCPACYIYPNSLLGCGKCPDMTGLSVYRRALYAYRDVAWTCMLTARAEISSPDSERGCLKMSIRMDRELATRRRCTRALLMQGMQFMISQHARGGWGMQLERSIWQQVGQTSTREHSQRQVAGWLHPHL